MPPGARRVRAGLGPALFALFVSATVFSTPAGGFRVEPDLATSVEAAEGVRDGAPGQSVTWALVDTWNASFGQASLLEPTGVDARADGTMYIADAGHRRIVVLDAAGAVANTIGGPAELAEPLDVAVDATRGRVYVADYGRRNIAVYGLDGTRLTEWRFAGPDDAFVPHAVSVDDVSGDVYTLSSGLVPRVERFASDGRWLAGWGSLGLGTGQFVGPNDLAIDAAQRVLVADGGSGRIQLFDSMGESLGQWSGLLGATALDTDAATGRVYVLAGSTSDRVVILSATGRIEATVVSRNLPPLQQWNPGRGLATTGAGEVAITTGFGSVSDAHGVRRFHLEPPTIDLAVITNPLDEDGFVGPTAIEAGSDGSVFVLDSPTRLMRRYDEAGQLLAAAVAGPGDELTVGPANEIYTVDLRRSITLRRFGPSGAWDWDKTCDCLSGMGVAANANRVFATDAVSRTVQMFDLLPNRQQPIDSLDAGSQSYVWPMDLDLAPDGTLWTVDGLASTIQVVDPSAKTVLRSVSLPAHGYRISVAPDGTAFVLLLDGTVVALSGAGATLGRWTVEPAAGADLARPVDIAAGTNGRVYVLDAASRSILVYAPGTDPGPEPVPNPCAATGDKTASPARVSLGQPVTVTLTLNIACAGGTGSDVVLILDRSSSMAGTGCSKLCEAKAAAAGFVNNLDLTKHRVAVVSFAGTAVLELGLSNDRAVILNAIQAILPAGNTNIAAALAVASAHIAASARPDALPVYLVLTDGDPSGTEQAFVDTVAEALRSRDTGGVLYTIGLGATVNADLLTTVAGAPERYFYAPSAAELGPIYQQLSESIAAIEATGLVVTDELGPNVEYVPGSATANGRLEGRHLIWDIGPAPAAGLVLTYLVRPTSVGRIPTNNFAEGTYGVAGSPQRYLFPVPEVEVVALLTPTLTPQPTGTATPTRLPPTSTPVGRPAEPLYLPLSMKNVCLARDRARGTDVVLALDTSSSMTGAKIQAAVSAAKAFLGQIDPNRDRVGVVSFDSNVRLVYLLSADLPSLHRALDGVVTTPGTRIDLGITGALHELTLRGRPGSIPVLVVLSDGRPTEGTESMTAASIAAVRTRGVTTFAVGLGADVDHDLMRTVASAPANYLFAPSPDDLERIYTSVAERLPCR